MLSDDDAREPGVQKYIEVEPGVFKDILDCSRSEIETRILSLTMQADALVAEAKELDTYLDGREA